MKYIQVGEIGKAVLVSTKSDLPTAGIAYLNKFYVATDTNIIYTCKPEGSGYAWKVVTVLPTLTNGIAAPTQLREGVEAIDGYGNKVTGTMKFVEKTANANGTYYPNDDNAQGYSKFIVDVAGSTAENPYIATTKEEMKAYLAEEYVGSFVRFENARYRNISIPYSLSTNLGNMASTTGAFDTYLGQSRMNKYIDNWTETDNNKLILSTDGTFSQNDISQTEKTNYHLYSNIYAYKYQNSDGSYCRALVYTIHVSRDTSINQFLSTLIYVDGYIENDTVFPTYNDTVPESSLQDQPSVTSDLNINVLGWCAGAPSGSPAGFWPKYISGYRMASESITQTNNTGNVTYLYADAAVICPYLFFYQFGKSGYEETDQKYQHLEVYKVDKSIVEVSHWQAESPIQVGDQFAGNTFYFNTNLTYDDLQVLYKEANIPSNEILTGEDATYGYNLFNVDNPIDTSSGDAVTIYQWLLSIRLSIDKDSDTLLGIGSYSYYVEHLDAPYIDFIFLGPPEAGQAVVGWIASNVNIATSYTDDEGTTVTMPATITKINSPSFVNSVIGKTANFTKGQSEQVAKYSFEHVIPAGDVEEVYTTADMNDFSFNPNNIGKVVRYAGYASSTPNPNYPYKKGALYILTED